MEKAMRDPSRRSPAGSAERCRGDQPPPAPSQYRVEVYLQVRSRLVHSVRARTRRVTRSARVSLCSRFRWKGHRITAARSWRPPPSTTQRYERDRPYHLRTRSMRTCRAHAPACFTSRVPPTTFHTVTPSPHPAPHTLRAYQRDGDGTGMDLFGMQTPDGIL